MAKEVTTAMTQQLVNPVPAFPIENSTAGYIATAVAGFVVLAYQLRKMVGKSNLGSDVDASAQAMLALSQQREKQAVADTREAYSLLNAQNLELGELRAQVKYLSASLAEAQAIVAEIRRGVQQVGQKVDNVQGRMEDTVKKIGNSGVIPLNKET